jgi:hypothetical protein
MDTKKLSHKAFLQRLTEVAERKLNINRYDRGFKRSIAKALGARDSTIQRWFDNSYPEAEYFIKFFNVFGITANELLGIESDAQPTLPLDLHKIRFIAAANTTDLPKQFLDPTKYSVGPILRDSKSVCFPDSIDEQDIESWGITRKDLVLQRESIYAVIVPERIGMSMWPIIKPGDLMVIDHGDKELIDGGIFALRLNGNRFTVRQIKKANNSIILIPWFLRQYQVEMINLDEHPNSVIGRVIFSVTYLTALGSEQLPVVQ